MHKILALAAFAATLWLGCAPARAQTEEARSNSICPTAPVGSNDNRCASTAFVNNAVQVVGGLPTLASGNIWIGNGSNLASPQVMSGDCVIAVGGGITCTKTGGVSFGASATLGIGNGLASSGGNLINSNPASVVNFYANPSTGSDSNDCQSTTVSGGHGPCLTIQKAVNVAQSYYVNGSSFTEHGFATPTVNLEGNYSTGAWIQAPTGGAFYLIINGNNFTVNDTTPNCWAFVVGGSGTNVVFTNISLGKNASGGCGTSAAAIFGQQNSWTQFSSGVNFVGSTGQHIHMEEGAGLEAGAYTISGSAACHYCLSHGHVTVDQVTVTCSLSNAYSYGAFAFLQQDSVLLAFNTFNNCGSETGERWIVETNSVIDASSASYYNQMPGSESGATQSGGRINPSPIPTISSCPGGVIGGGSTDNAFTVGFTSSIASCAISFGQAKQASTPICTGNNTGGAAMGIGATQSVVTLLSAFVNTETAYVICSDTPN